MGWPSGGARHRLVDCGAVGQIELEVMIVHLRLGRIRFVVDREQAHDFELAVLPPGSA